ncbi:MarR family winged helix-turn-helix transcriptional regulator [Streptomyces sp. NPDC057717]|uniref:MarR family winged helix-turn-helix transcriptional regulator n=1 Tax=Streptomyces sp. NPDC057717 TaxID=3346224 RepID=UPI0036C3CCC6
MRQAMNSNGPTDLTHTEVMKLAQAADALFYAMRRSRASTSSRNDSPLSEAHLALLAPLCDEEELPVRQLAAAASVSVPTATRMLQQLEAKGAIRRQRSAVDERQVLITLTEQGACALAQVQARLRERQTRVFATFTPAERTQLSRYLQRLAAAIAAVAEE